MKPRALSLISAGLLLATLCHCVGVEQNCPSGQELVAGSCQDIECSVDCADGNDCTEDICDTGACSNPPEPAGTSCDFEGLSGLCSMGACEDAALCADVDCDDDDDCTEDLCDPITGQCSNPNEPDNTSCAFGELPGVCMAGQCEGLCANKTCGDGNDCTQDVCDALTGQCSNPNESDDSFCGFGGLPGFCAAGVCQDAMLCAGKSCDDENECTDNDCHPANGECLNTPVPNEATCTYTPTPLAAGVCFNATCGCDPAADACAGFDSCTTEECDTGTRACIVTNVRTSGSCTTSIGLSGTCLAGLCIPF